MGSFLLFMESDLRFRYSPSVLLLAGLYKFGIAINKPVYKLS
jgi:hypothetical protein